MLNELRRRIKRRITNVESMISSIPEYDINKPKYSYYNGLINAYENVLNVIDDIEDEN